MFPKKVTGKTEEIKEFLNHAKSYVQKENDLGVLEDINAKTTCRVI